MKIINIIITTVLVQEVNSLFCYVSSGSVPGKYEKATCSGGADSCAVLQMENQIIKACWDGCVPTETYGQKYIRIMKCCQTDFCNDTTRTKSSKLITSIIMLCIKFVFQSCWSWELFGSLYLCRNFCKFFMIY